MKRKTLTLALVIAASIATAHAANSPISLNTETANASNTLGASAVSEVKFEEGKTTLAPAELNEVLKTINAVKSSGEIQEVKIITWADREFPAKGTTTTNTAVKLAEQRGDYIKKYVKEELKVGSVNTFNMAKRSNTLQEFLNTPTARVKKTLEESGAAPTNREDAGFMGLKGKTSAALVLVYTKK